MAERRYPIQGGPSVPWEFMVPHEAQHKANHGGQTLEHMAQRGGLGATESWCCVYGMKLWPTHDTDEGIEKARKGWLELAERVNREWSVKQARAEVLASAMKQLEDWGDGELATCLRDELQPAAADLEELLREERLNEANAHSTAFNLAMLAHQPERYAQWRAERIAELEKARAEGKG